MTTAAALLPDDALDLDSLVGRMLRQSESEYLPNTTETSEPQPVAGKSSATEPLPLWRVIQKANYEATQIRDEPSCPAEIEALRDWLLPEEPEPSAYDGRPRYEQRHIIWTHNRKLRAALTEQARIARTGQ
jgi:hypothetical protein